MKIIKRILPIIVLVIGFICGIIFYASASTYNSEEITYDNSISHAEAKNVKDAIDYLYSHGSCDEGMSCLESPTVSINIVGSGTVNVSSIKVPINGRNTFKVTPNSGYVLHSITCEGGYTLGSFNTLSNSTNELASQEQEITVNNQRIFDNNTCTVTFGTNDITIQSDEWSEVGTTGGYDKCYSANVNCVCYYIKNGGSNFTYGSHTGCNFKSTTCKYATYSEGSSFDCSILSWGGSFNGWRDNSDNVRYSAACSGVITCAT